MLNLEQLEQMGDNLRMLGHRRRELVEKIVSEVDEKDLSSSKSLFQELSEISEKAISIMQEQKDFINDTIEKLQ